MSLSSLLCLMFLLTVAPAAFGQSIVTGTVTGPLCAGQSVDVPYTYSGPALVAGNQFIAELSDASGSFAAPVTIGSLNSTSTAFTVDCAIPNTIVAGTGYRVRVRSTNPVAVGSPNPLNITLVELYTGQQIFVETMGTSGGTVSVGTHETNNGFSNVGFTMSGSAGTGAVNVRNWAPVSTGYTGASGGASVRFQTAGFFEIAGINTTAYSNLGLGFGILKNDASADGSTLVVSVSTDGITYTDLSFPLLPTGGGTNNEWFYRVTEGTIPTTANLRIRFTYTGGTSLNIDDVELGDAVSPATLAVTPPGPISACNPASIVLTATNVANANYQWYNPFPTAIGGATSNTRTVTSTGNYAVQASDLFGCAARRNVSVTVAASFTPAVVVSTASTSVCAGSSVTFTATPTHGGLTPSYQWLLNGSPVGTNSPTYTTSSLATGNTVQCVLTSSLSCATTNPVNSNTLTMTVNSRPTASLSGSTTICAGSSTPLTIAVTGSGTISGTLSPGNIPFSGTAPSIVVNVSPASATTYTVNSLSDANCTANAGDLTGSYAVAVNARPTASLSGSSTICNGVSQDIVITVAGSGTISGTLSPGNIPFSGTAPSITVSVSPSSSTTYTVNALSDANCASIAGDLTGSFAVTVNQRPTASLSGSSSICLGSSTTVTVNVTGSGTISGTLSPGGIPFSGTAPSITVNVSPSSNTTYTVSALGDANCTSVAGDLTGSHSITVNNRPTGSISGTTTICGGSSTTLDIAVTGTGTISGTLNPGAIPFSGTAPSIAVNVTPSSTTTYTVASLNDANCTALAGDLSGSATITVLIPVTYYQDSDEDGYGSNTVFVSTCSGAPLGYITVSGDCNDANSDINAGMDEWFNGMDDDCDGLIDEGTSGTTFYQDSDGDGYGNAAVTVVAFSAPSGYVAVAGDCNDAVATAYPGALEQCNGIDDDCDGIVDEGCGPINDERYAGLPITVGILGSCNAVNGTLTGATWSIEATMAAPTGEDVWYYFTAPAHGVRIQCITTAADVLIELQTDAGVMVDSENLRAGAGNEILNFGSLTPGATYFVRVANYDSAGGTGSFQLCASRMVATNCDYGPGPYSLCQVFKANYTGASQYAFTFTPNGGGAPLTATTSGGVTTLPLTQVPGLLYGQSYTVGISAIYTVTDGLGNTETVVLPAFSTCTMLTAAQPDADLRSTDAFPVIRYTYSIIGTNQWICGASYFEWEFTQTAPSAGLPFTVNGPANSRYLNLTGTGVVAGGTYNVRMRPMFQNGAVAGDWGTDYQVLQIMGLASAAAEDESLALDMSDASALVTKEGVDTPAFGLYPNPNAGDRWTIVLPELEEGDLATVVITDAMGREVSRTVHGTGGQKNVLPAQVLPAGLYTVSVKTATQQHTQRMLVAR